MQSIIKLSIAVFTAASLTHAFASNDSLMKLKASYVVLDVNMKPLSGMTVTGTYSYMTGGGFLSSPESKAEPFSCVSDDTGRCVTDAPATLSRYGFNIPDGVQLQGRVANVRTPAGEVLEIPKEKDMNRIWVYVDAKLLADNTVERNIYIEGKRARLSGEKVIAVEAIKAKISVDDDDLETDVKVDTLESQRLWHPRPDSTKADRSFIRAWINKKTGVKKFQVYDLIQYGKVNGFKSFNRATMPSDSGPVEAVLLKIKDDVKCGGDDGCWYQESVGFSVTEDALRAAAIGHIDGSDKRWNYRLFANSGDRENRNIPVFEIAGLLAKVDEVSSKIGKPSTR
jgi:hypothetical protein